MNMPGYLTHSEGRRRPATAFLMRLGALQEFLPSCRPDGPHEVLSKGPMASQIANY